MDRHKSMYKENISVLSPVNQKQMNRDLLIANRARQRKDLYLSTRNISLSPSPRKISPIAETTKTPDKENGGQNQNGNDKTFLNSNTPLSPSTGTTTTTAAKTPDIENGDKTVLYSKRIICEPQIGEDPKKLSRKQAYLIRFMEWKDKRKANDAKKNGMARKPFLPVGIATGSNMSTSFAPSNHIFKAPKGLKNPATEGPLAMPPKVIERRKSLYMAIPTPPRNTKPDRELKRLNKDRKIGNDLLRARDRTNVKRAIVPNPRKTNLLAAAAKNATKDDSLFTMLPTTSKGAVLSGTIRKVSAISSSSRKPIVAGIAKRTPVVPAVTQQKIITKTPSIATGVIPKTPVQTKTEASRPTVATGAIPKVPKQKNQVQAQTEATRQSVATGAITKVPKQKNQMHAKPESSRTTALCSSNSIKPIVPVLRKTPTVATGAIPKVPKQKNQMQAKTEASTSVGPVKKRPTPLNIPKLKWKEPAAPLPKIVPAKLMRTISTKGTRSSARVLKPIRGGRGVTAAGATASIDPFLETPKDFDLTKTFAPLFTSTNQKLLPVTKVNDALVNVSTIGPVDTQRTNEINNTIKETGSLSAKRALVMIDSSIVEGKEQLTKNTICAQPNGIMDVKDLNFIIMDTSINSPEVVAASESTEQTIVTHSRQRTLDAIQRFRRQLNDEIDRLHAMCDQWDAYKADNMERLEETGGDDMVNGTIGQTRLLTSKKFMQFRGLIDRCEAGANGTAAVDDGSEATKPISIVDLEGFWSMLGLQVDNLEKRFTNLQRWRDNNWMDPDDVEKPKEKTKILKRVMKAKPSAAAVKAKPNLGLMAMMRKMHAEMRKKKDDASPATPTITNLRRSNSSTPKSSQRRRSIVVKDRKSFSAAPTRLSIMARLDSVKGDSPASPKLVGLIQEMKNNLSALKKTDECNDHRGMALLGGTSSMAPVSTPQCSWKGRKSILKTPGTGKGKPKNVIFSEKLEAVKFNFIIDDDDDDDDDDDYNNDDKNNINQNAKAEDHTPDQDDDNENVDGDKRTYSLRTRTVKLRPSSEIFIP